MSFTNPYWAGSLVKNSLSAVENGFARKRKVSSMGQGTLARLCWHLNSDYMHTFPSSFPTCKVQIIPYPGSHASKVMMKQTIRKHSGHSYPPLFRTYGKIIMGRVWDNMSLAADGYVWAPGSVLELGEWWWEEGFFYKALGGENLTLYWANHWRSFTKGNMAQEKSIAFFYSKPKLDRHREVGRQTQIK